MKALVLTPSTATTEVRDVPRPSPGTGEVLIRVHAVALNPVDSFYINNPIATQDQRIVGTDFAGVVVGASGDLSGVSDRRVEDGTRVAGFLQGGAYDIDFLFLSSILPSWKSKTLTTLTASSANDRPGAFAEYITAPYDLIWAIPDALSFEEASTISMCGLTAAQGVFDRFGLPSPFSPGKVPSEDPLYVLVNGASTSLGQLVAQLVHLAAETSGRTLTLIGTASPSKHDFLRSAPYKYDTLVDYRESNWPEKVRAATNGVGVHFALDTISEFDTVVKVHETLHASGKYHVFRSPAGGKFDTSSLAIRPIYGAVWEGLGFAVDYGDGMFFHKGHNERPS